MPEIQANPIVLKPAAPQPVAAPAPVKKHRLVDVAQFRIMPGAGAPQVSAEVDATLGSTGLLPWILTRVEAIGSVGVKAANGVRFLTRLLGPALFGFSAVWNAMLLPKALKDPTLGKGSKAMLVFGEVGTILGAATALAAALPAKLAGLLRLSSARQVLANKTSGIAGGVAGIGFAAINLVETMHNPDSKPAERFFAKLGFGIGAIGFVAGTAALAISMGMGAPAWLLPVASKIATVAGIGGVASMLGQLFMGKNKTLNAKLDGSILA
ncbi:MAG: hypothetical protein JWM80_1633 [Cyanobacteria bacterium RYN_339]|nr:hypothetical protein [Cyanobacteria bacterium RYN_339]